MLRFFLTFLLSACLFQITSSTLAFNTDALSQPTSSETTITITGMTSADTTTNFAFRTIGGSKWQNGLFSPPNYFAISNFRKVTATSSTTGTAVLAPFTLGETQYQELVVVTAVAQNFSLSVTGTAYTLNNYPPGASKTLLNGVTFKNLASFVFGSSTKGFSKARKTSSGTKNYGGIIATRIIGLNDTAPADPMLCRVRLNATGIINSVMLGSDVVLADSSRTDSVYEYFLTGDRYTFQRSEYQLLSIFGSIELDVTLTDLYDCLFENGTVVTPPSLDIYSVSSKMGNSTTTATAAQAITCPSGCTQCDKANNCLQNSSCLFDPGSGSCITNLSCPDSRPYALTNRTDMRQQCFVNLTNQILLEELIVSTTNITIGVVENPTLSSSTSVDQYCFIYAEVGVFTASSKFFFPLNYPGTYVPQLASASSRIIYKFTNYVYNPTFPFAPKTVTGIEVGPTNSSFTMVVRNLTSLQTNSAGWNAILTPGPELFTGYEFTAVTSFTTVKNNYYMIQFYITYASTDRMAFRIPTTQLLLYINGNLSTISTTSGLIGLNPNQCTVGAACWIHMGFKANANGIFMLDQSLLSSTAGYTTPTTREIKQIVFQSDPNCPTGSYIQDDPSSCGCDDGYYPNTTTVVCTACDSSCKTCSGWGANNCTSCYDPFTLENSTCVCPTGYEKSGTTCQLITSSGGTTGGEDEEEEETSNNETGEETSEESSENEEGDAGEESSENEEGSSSGNEEETSEEGSGSGNEESNANEESLASEEGSSSGNEEGNTNEESSANEEGSSSGNEEGEVNEESSQNEEDSTSEGDSGEQGTGDPSENGEGDDGSTDDSDNTGEESTEESSDKEEDDEEAGDSNNNNEDEETGSSNHNNEDEEVGSSNNNEEDEETGSSNNNEEDEETGSSDNNEEDEDTGGSNNNEDDEQAGSSNNNNEESFSEETTTGGSGSGGNSTTTTPGKSVQNSTDPDYRGSGASTSSTSQTLISESTSSPWIEIVYILFYGIALIISFIYLKKYAKNLVAVKPYLYEHDVACPKKGDHNLLSTFINYSAVLFFKNKNLSLREKSVRGFHLAILLNVKLYTAALIAKLLSQTETITSETVSSKFAIIITIEIIMSIVIEYIYSILFRILSGAFRWFLALITITSVALVVVVERISLSKLENLAGVLLLCFFLASAIIQWIWIDCLLAVATFHSFIMRILRRFNLFRVSGSGKVQAASIAPVPSLTNVTNVSNTVNSTNRNLVGNRIFKRLDLDTVKDENPNNNVLEPGLTHIVNGNEVQDFYIKQE